MIAAQQIKFNAALISIIAVTLFAGNVLLPYIPVAETLPKIHFPDFFLPVIAVLLLPKINSLIGDNRLLILILFFLFLSECFSILINGRITMYRDYFELLKVVKFGLIIFFFAEFGKLVNWEPVFKILLAVLLVFNLFHYIDLFNFNDIIMPCYGSDIQVQSFGVNSLGEPAAKRILGTLGNPNNNAILFLFFVIYFIKDLNKKLPVWFYLSVLAFLACQSRTGFIAFVPVFFWGTSIYKIPVKRVVQHTIIIIIEYFLLLLIGEVYIASLADKAILQSNSVNDRLKTWKFLGEMILQRPIFGYGPDKIFFEERNLFSENEYVLFAWRYGFVGLFAYISLYVRNFIISVAEKGAEYSILLLLYTLVMVITALTNNPLSEQVILVIYAFVIGMSLSNHTPAQS